MRDICDEFWPFIFKIVTIMTTNNFVCNEEKPNFFNIIKKPRGSNIFGGTFTSHPGTSTEYIPSNLVAGGGGGHGFSSGDRTMYNGNKALFTAHKVSNSIRSMSAHISVP